MVISPSSSGPFASAQRAVDHGSYSTPSVPKSESGITFEVLVVEDSPSDQLLIKAALSESHRVIYNITCVGSLRDANAVLNKERFDVVVSDLDLPDSRGIKTIQQLVNISLGIPVIALIEHDSDEIGLSVLKDGAIDYVAKSEMSGRVLSRTIRYAVDRNRIEEQLRHAQRMESLGVLAGGIAHDFNNLLMVIRGNAEMQERLRIDSPKLGKTSNQIRSASDRAATLTRQLLAFSRRERVYLSSLDCNEMLSEFSRMIQRLLGPTIEFNLTLADRPLMVSGDPGLLEQIIMNLVVNSRDAMPEGGRLNIETSVVEIQADRGQGVPPAGPGPYVTMAVTDSGSGISQEIQERIFEPFYTTKAEGKGTGLGLSTAFGIVQQHRGSIEVQSEAGTGTEFRVLLPLVDDQISAVSPVIEEAPNGNSEMVLVVDDEELIRELCASFLEMQGYRVIQASSGAEVIERWGELKTKVNLVLTDLIMPQGVSGHELGEWLYDQDPTLKVIYCSGFSQPNLKRRFNLREGTNFLSKPFSSDSLLNMVHQVLANKED